MLDEINGSSPQPSLIASKIQRIRDRLRRGQQQMADWRGGPLAVSAVPGAGKSTGMASAAAIAIAHYQLHAGHQLVVCTFTRSAAANIKIRIRRELEALGLPNSGFIVSTLHGLALNIATRHPELSGLNLNNSTLITPTQSHRLIRSCVEQWIVENRQRYQVLLTGKSFDGEETERLRRQSVLVTDVLPELAHTVIHEAKSSGLQPDHLWTINQGIHDDEYEILAIAAGLYESYQNLLRSRNLIDYDEMILAALRVLENDTARRFWQTQIFAVFEDEAQDSSPLQTQFLETLAAQPDSNHPLEKKSLNLIRVGDPNQAINSSFTPADPIYFREFCESCRHLDRLATMDYAGRSTQIIIDAANFVLTWVNAQYRQKNPSFFSHLQHSSFKTNQDNFPDLKSLPFQEQKIYPVDSHDPQPGANPPPEGRGLELYTPRDIYHTVELMGERAIALLTQNPEDNAAILVRENRQARFIKQVLDNPQRYGIKLMDLASNGIAVLDVGSSDRRSAIPAEILTLLQFIDRPHSPDYLKAALNVLVKRQLIETQDLDTLASLPEQFLYPTFLDPPQSEPVRKARHLCSTFLHARQELPLFQLISFLALSLGYNSAELATAEKLAERIGQQTSGSLSMPDILNVLREIVGSEQFEPVEAEESDSFYTRKRQLTILTMHKAKGLDWDYVFLPFLHENVIPGSRWIPPQAQFLGDFTLAEVARAQIRAHLHSEGNLLSINQAWHNACALKTAEEFRLLYVAMTRAKRLLWMSAAAQAPFTWSKPENFDQRQPCPVFPALQKQFPASVISYDRGASR